MHKGKIMHRNKKMPDIVRVPKVLNAVGDKIKIWTGEKWIQAEIEELGKRFIIAKTVYGYRETILYTDVLNEKYKGIKVA